MKRNITIICIPLVFAFFIVLAMPGNRMTHAGGGRNYKVRVENPTDKSCRVWVYVEKLHAQVAEPSATIPPGGHHTWETGSHCPCSLEGQVYDPVGNQWRQMRCMNMYGHKIDCNAGLGSEAVCSSHDFIIRGKTRGSQVRDYDYGFRKD